MRTCVESSLWSAVIEQDGLVQGRRALHDKSRIARLVSADQSYRAAGELSAYEQSRNASGIIARTSSPLSSARVVYTQHYGTGAPAR